MCKVALKAWRGDPRVLPSATLPHHPQPGDPLPRCEGNPPAGQGRRQTHAAWRARWQRGSRGGGGVGEADSRGGGPLRSGPQSAPRCGGVERGRPAGGDSRAGDNQPVTLPWPGVAGLKS